MNRLALYEIELNVDGNPLSYGRTRRYMRGEPLPPIADSQQTPDGNVE
jgi:hypothetical protein